MVFKLKFCLITLLSFSIIKTAHAQRNVEISVLAGYRANFAKTSVTDRFTTYSLNYYAHAPGFYTALNLTVNKFFLRPSFSRYGVVHNHGVYNRTIFFHSSPKNRNVRNDNSMMEFNVDLGLEFELGRLVLRGFAGVGWVSTLGQDWKTSNVSVPMTVSSTNNTLQVPTYLEIMSQSFYGESFTSNFGLGMYMPVLKKLICEFNISYQTHFDALAANSGTYKAVDPVTSTGLSGGFNSILTGAWILQVGIGYSLF